MDLVGRDLLSAATSSKVFRTVLLEALPPRETVEAAT
jgi:hypothetical protein